MKVFHCGNCDRLVFFENTACVCCQHTLAYLPDRSDMGTLEPAGENVFRAIGQPDRKYRLCVNYEKENVCNWVVPADDPDPYCASCRLTEVIPDLDKAGNREAWGRLEVAKRRLVYSLLLLQLPLKNKEEDPEHGLSFKFLADPPKGTPDAKPVFTGHADGVITVNIAEANDAERERRRTSMNEPYRTLLGHMRHESGHYYWDRLIKDSAYLDEYRALFGDEREDYGEALKRYHAKGPAADWSNSFVSAYASSHSWEDWAESWAHYLHIIDTMETAVACGLSLKPKRPDEPSMTPNVAVTGRKPSAFDDLMDRWFPLTYVLNNLNRGMGQPDAYPFVLTPSVIQKLGFIDRVVSEPQSLLESQEKPGVLETATARS
jgi:hypothetical protein